MHDLLTLGGLYHDLKRRELGTCDRPAETAVHDQLYAVASACAALKAQSLPELAVKAQMLLEYADPLAADIVTQLLQSLCRDVVSLAAPPGQPSG